MVNNALKKIFFFLNKRILILLLMGGLGDFWVFVVFWFGFFVLLFFLALSVLYSLGFDATMLPRLKAMKK